MSIVTVVDDQDDPLPADDYVALATGVLAAEGCPRQTEVTLHLVLPSRSAELNAAHLGRQGPTDVLSFPLEDLAPGVLPEPQPGGPPLHLGDVVVCPASVRDQAAREGVAFDAQMALMVVHGLLHLLGYDHQDDADAELMEARERTLLSKFAPTPS